MKELKSWGGLGESRKLDEEREVMGEDGEVVGGDLVSFDKESKSSN